MDVAVFVNTSDIPDPFKVGTTNLLPVHVTVDGADIVNVHVIVTLDSMTDEFDTNLLMPTDNFEYTTRFNPDAADSAATLTLQVKLPAGYVDVNKGNNKVTISVDIEN